MKFTHFLVPNGVFVATLFIVDIPGDFLNYSILRGKREFRLLLALRLFINFKESEVMSLDQVAANVLKL